MRLSSMFGFGRTNMIRPWIPEGARVLDIGCRQGELLLSLGDAIGPSVGYDSAAPVSTNARFCLVPEEFPTPTAFTDASFDVVILSPGQTIFGGEDYFGREIFRLLRCNGRVIVTVSTRGMFFERSRTTACQPSETLQLLSRHGLVIEAWQPFQFGMQHLFVFRKPLPAQQRPASDVEILVLRQCPVHA